MKATPEKLLGEIADDFCQFLRQGQINVHSFTEKSQPNLNIDDVRKLLRIHFVLTKSDDPENPGVIDFLEKLPHRIRRIKTTVSHTKNRFEGEVRGRVCWKSTFNMRFCEMPMDKTTYICTQREKNFDIPENLILKKLLRIIYGIASEDLKPAIDHKYSWIGEWFENDKSLLNTLENIFFRNIYLRRITLVQEEINPRMIANAKKSRKPLYREAAYLLERFYNLMNYDIDADEARELLKNTFIKPERTEVLFELYWAINIVKAFQDNAPYHLAFKLLEPGSGVVAEWGHGDCIYKLYHDSTGSFTFHENLKDHITGEEDDNYISREIQVLRALSEIVDVSESNTLWGGRPDIILERYSAGDSPKLESIIIGEVKYTESSGYAIQGLRELLEYIALIRKAQKEPYIVAKDKLFEQLGDNDIPIFGILFTDTIDGLSLKSSKNGGKNGIYLVKYPHKNDLSTILKNNSVLPPKSN